MNEEVSSTANLLGDPGRAAILLSLMGGVSRPAGELAQVANIAPLTASAHLAKLVSGCLLSVECVGRHRYYRLASAEVADAIEGLLVLTGQTLSCEKNANTRKATAGTLTYARTCYSHLAGRLGVQILEALEARALLAQTDSKVRSVTPTGRGWFVALGIEIAPPGFDHPRLARRCLDWTDLLGVLIA